MKIRNVDQLTDFLKVIDSCTGNVYLTSVYGDKYNLKSALTQYIAIAGLLGAHGDELEIWCDNKEDEGRIMEFLSRHKDI